MKNLKAVLKPESVANQKPNSPKKKRKGAISKQTSVLSSGSVGSASTGFHGAAVLDEEQPADFLLIHNVFPKIYKLDLTTIDLKRESSIGYLLKESPIKLAKHSLANAEAATS